MAKVIFNNREIAKLLKSVSAVYAIRGGNYFQMIAYDRAADNIEHSTSELKDLWEDNKLDTIAGLGQGIQGYLDELFRTGKVKHFESLKKGMPPGMFELLDVPGMGPKTAYKLTKELEIKNITDLEKAARGGKIRQLPGFGAKSEEGILTAIGEIKARSDRVVLPFAFETAQRVLDYLRKLPECKRAEPLGSLRRMVATVGDIDIAVASTSPQKVVDYFTKFKETARILDAGVRKSSILLTNGMQVDLLVGKPQAFGALLQHFTGSKNHNIHLRELAQKKNISVSDYGITSASGGKNKLHEFKTEEEFYNFLGMDYIEPELREDTGEIEAALAHKLPALIESSDIKGDIHIHSNYPIEPSHDFGADSFETLIKKAESLKYEYLGLSDHSPSASTHNQKQIVDLVKKRSEKIEQLKSSHKDISILNLLEIDILSNYQLSVPEEGLKLLDGAIAGIHSSHRQDKKTQTKRMLVAIRSPYVQVISHPTGRLLGKREAYELDWPLIFKECVRNKTLLEINAWPTRLDLPDTLTRDAIKAGVKLVINSDSHAVSHMDNLKYGIAVARRGWAEKKDIANTSKWLEFKKWFNV